MEKQEIRNLHSLKTQVSIRIWEEIVRSKLKVTLRSKMRQKWTLYIISVLLYVGLMHTVALKFSFLRVNQYERRKELEECESY